MNEIVTYQECFQHYPDQWILLEAISRDENNGGLVSGRVLAASIIKQDILDIARGMKASGKDICVTCTINTLEDALKFVYFDSNLTKQEYVSPDEYAFMFNLFYGLTYNEYLE